MTAEMPLVTIGMPVYNEARFIDASLQSLRRQDYPNLEIVVADNASTDATLDICRRHAAEDPRIRIECVTKNRGAIANFEYSLSLAHGQYFMWAAGHDLWSPGLVSECVELLEGDQRACLAYASSNWIGANGEPLPRVSGWADTRGLTPIARLFTVFWGNMHPVTGLMRTRELLACLPLRHLAGGDLVLLSQLALRGAFLHARNSLWSRREFRIEHHHDDKLRRYASTSTRIVQSRLWKMFPLLQLPFALMRVVLQSNLSATDKCAVIFALVPAFPLRYLVGRRGLVD